ncbi:MAG: TetR family transcriptional regulator [Erythrobacter sp.]|nr:TetR family transcriptional regulator [Erythrobacter sp.]
MGQIEPQHHYAGSDSPEDTRERLLTAALSQFAERGFYGASIAQIAGEVDLTKQALLYYFKRKEDLYAEVLKRIAARLLAATHAGVDEDDTPEVQFEGMIMGIYAETQARPLHTRVLLRELMDNQRSDATADKWYLKTWLDAVVGQLEKIECLSDMPFEEKFANIYQMLSAIEYFTVSGPTLSRMYGEERFAKIAENYPAQLLEQVRHFITCRGRC